MAGEIFNLVSGAIGGGLVAAGLRVFENYFLAPRLAESVEARKKILLYSKPLWRACHDLHYRLFYIKKKMHSPRATLAASPQDAESLQWFTTSEGNYITSAAYMIATVACWIALYERDAVFLQFGQRSLTAQFLLKTESFKQSISSNKSILWFNYVNGIGEQLIQEETNRPVTFSSFCQKLLRDQDFRDYYTQLFCFLNEVNQGKFEASIENTLVALDDIKKFLVSNGIVVEMPEEFGPKWD
ncbi:hypothetical protein [Leptolyngbya sp. FACHB-261]|uniref:hypothetical protein n=1 Tax=Leptolyngbya sp. FACHB-261 TaxID=2692806 RepID=UPI00168874E6|nr:hypothetical protein [Leptolyngbya sp. FACHB-261]MBD2104830.1 hypothetical protein [Leptolyngbya sp. FACHB-261]